MTLKHIRLFSFTVDVESYFRKKEGIALFARTYQGKTAWSEVSPLPGFSHETLEQTKKQLFQLKEELLPLSIEEALTYIYSQDLYPSVSFGVEALLQALLPSAGFPLFSYPICAFLHGTFEEMQRKIPSLLKLGYRYVKIKLGALSLPEAHQIIRMLLGKIKLKVDLNRKWSLTESLSFFSDYPENSFEYIEEPVSHPDDLSLFPYPIALDETLRTGSVPPHLSIKAMILKPMLVGSTPHLQKILKQARSIQAEVVISSSHESGIGLYHLCALQERLNLPVHPLGVDTYRLISKDLLKTPHQISRGMLKLSSLDLQLHRLQEITHA